MANKKKLEADIRAMMKGTDVEKALEVLRQGMEAVSVVKTSEGGHVVHREKPDMGTRVTCAKLLLEWGFGKPATKQTIELEQKHTVQVESPADIASRLRASGVDLNHVAQVYLDNARSPTSADVIEVNDEQEQVGESADTEEK
tara:strand:- start:804 stop:1232 length:429 start_codon:yes stop_codon:yes gene_type:complete